MLFNILRKTSLFALAILALCATSCDGGYLCNQSADVKGEAWTYEDTLKFSFDIADTTGLYEMNLEVTYNDAYAFHNLYVQFHTTFPSGRAEKRVVSLELAKPSGISNGNCSGKKCTVNIPLQAKAIFKEKGTHTLALEQYMRQPSLPGIKNMRLKVKKLA